MRVKSSKQLGFSLHTRNTLVRSVFHCSRYDRQSSLASAYRKLLRSSRVAVVDASAAPSTPPTASRQCPPVGGDKFFFTSALLDSAAIPSSSTPGRSAFHNETNVENNSIFDILSRAAGVPSFFLVIPCRLPPISTSNGLEGGADRWME